MRSQEDARSLEKRLIISGITPAISPSEIQQRLSLFGKVKSVDGFGQLDGIGQPRKFGFISLETTQPKLARCMNTLNGTTWKGTKLRIGEAHPDYKQRLEQERNQTLNVPGPSDGNKTERLAKKTKKAAKRKKRSRNREVGDMRPTTLQNVQYRKGWKRTTLDHLVRPVRMRPSHPLPSVTGTLSSRTPSKGLIRPQKRKLRPPPTRARVTLIDPTRYGAVHLSAESGFLGAEVVGYEPPSMDEPNLVDLDQHGKGMDSEDGSGEVETVRRHRARGSSISGTECSTPVQNTTQVSQPSSSALRLPEPPSMDLDPEQDLTAEKSKNLSILESLLVTNEANQLQWEPDSDLEKDIAIVRAEEERLQETANQWPNPHNKKSRQVKRGSTPDKVGESSEESEEEPSSDPSEDLPDSPSPAPPSPRAAKSTISSTSQVRPKTLKELFAPREEEEGFTLLSTLNIDDAELDEEMAPLPPTQPTERERLPDVTTTVTQSLEINFDPSIPLFFLRPRDPETGLPEFNPGGASRRGGRPRDMLDVFDEVGRDTFWKTETDEEIQKYWEEVKGDLTQEYKRRHREAVKKKRRGFGGGRPESDDVHR